MKTTGRYCFVSCNYDIDHIINNAVENTKLFVINMTNNAESKEDAKKVLLAITQQLVEELAKM